MFLIPYRSPYHLFLVLLHSIFANGTNSIILGSIGLLFYNGHHQACPKSDSSTRCNSAAQLQLKLTLKKKNLPFIHHRSQLNFHVIQNIYKSINGHGPLHCAFGSNSIQYKSAPRCKFSTIP